MSKFEKNLSEGSVVKQLILFSLPFLFSNIIQSLYSVADMIIVGQFSGTASMSGVNIGGQVTFLITNMIIGLTVGATVMIGQYMGANDRKSLVETIGTLFTTLSVLAVVITVAMLFLETPILRLIKTPEESFSEAADYFFITMLGTVFIFAYNAISAVLRGMGDSKNPLVFVAIACAVNVALDLLFVGKLNMGAKGAAIATVASQAISVIISVIYLEMNDFMFKFNKESFVIHPEKLRLLLKIGVPTLVQNVATSVSFLFLTALVNIMGVTASAAVGAVGKINSFAILPAIAMSASVSAMSAQNIGAGEYGRAKKTMYTGGIIAMAISCIIFALVTIYPEYFLRVFGNDPAMIAGGVEYMKSFSFDYLTVPFLFCLNGLFTGSGHTTFSFVNSMISSLLIRIPASYLFGMVLDRGLFGIGLGGPLASLVALLVAVGFYISGKWKKRVIHV